MKRMLVCFALLLTAAVAVAGTTPAPQAHFRHPVPPGHPGGGTPPAPARLELGAPAPNFTLDALKGLEFKRVSLSDYRGKWVVLFFYPGDFTFVCPTEIKGFNKALSEFRGINAEILAVSTDSKYSHLGWVKSGALDTLDYPLLSDFNKGASRAYGVLDEAQGTARRGLFIIDPRGVLQHIVVHNDKVGRSIDETLRVLKALQTDELCPLNWRPGDKTLKK